MWDEYVSISAKQNLVGWRDQIGPEATFARLPPAQFDYYEMKMESVVVI
jgi:hypothetical protein